MVFDESVTFHAGIPRQETLIVVVPLNGHLLTTSAGAGPGAGR
jgi:hypothetical protein